MMSRKPDVACLQFPLVEKTSLVTAIHHGNHVFHLFGNGRPGLISLGAGSLPGFDLVPRLPTPALLVSGPDSRAPAFSPTFGLLRGLMCVLACWQQVFDTFLAHLQHNISWHGTSVVQTRLWLMPGVCPACVCDMTCRQPDHV